MTEGSLVSLFPFPEPPPEYFCKMLGHDFMRWTLPLTELPRIDGFPQVGMCSRCFHPLLRPKTSEST